MRDTPEGAFGLYCEKNFYDQLGLLSSLADVTGLGYVDQPLSWRR